MEVALITGLLLCAGLVLPARGADLDAEIDARRRAGYELQQKMLQYDETADRTSRQARGLQARLADLQKNSEIASQQIKLLELQSDKLQSSMRTLDGEIAGIARQVEELEAELRLRVIDMHKFGAREELNLLLSAESAHEAVSLAYLLSRLARHDRFAIEDLLNKITELGYGKRVIEKNKAGLQARAEELNVRREQYGEVIKQTNKALSGVRQEHMKAEASVKETEQAQRDLERSIAELMRRKRGQSADAVPGENTGAGTYPVIAAGARLDWPVRGAVVSHFGPKDHPATNTKSFNSGIDISAASGAMVQAAGPGEVIYEGWQRGFGQVVVIDHGRNISTVYAHLASARVKMNDAVMPGTVIGTVGSSGTEDGCRLHFEVRVGEAAENPLDYLKKS